MKVAASAVTNTVNNYSIISDNNTAAEAMVDSVIYNYNKGIKADPDRSAPIGLFDSGIGGLSVYLHLAQQLPNERYIYYADTLNVPYGNRDSDDIKTLTLTAVEWLYQQGCKLIVIACNSASAYALQTARCHYPQLPIVGLVPALKPAVLASKSGHVAVLATKATLNGKLLNDVIATIASPSATRVTKYFDPQLVPWVESGMPENSETAQNLRGQLQVFAKDGVDQLVLGCTHYPFFKDFVMQAIESQRLSMQVVDSGQAIAERVKQLLIVNNLSALPIDGLSRNGVLDASLSDSPIKPPLIFYATKYDKQMDLLLSRLLGEQTHLQYHPHFEY
ncbi:MULTISPECIES: glutamate racemase [unclassified Psychrobacter]|uniref:glutamate racemase n=1 Tax=unclassified Psychrobacter TaxID=196806 RepID=UPI00191B4741|nr:MULTISPECIES: glutamate racemase [unclassified Psychrobacter]|tara:strand:+ start:14385 stop:15386 length:1002 start_codon:yes stop_codon:yes gene_type:complete